VFALSSTTALMDINTAINSISSMAASLGAVQNRMQSTSNAISATQENMASSLSNIQDVNMATEMTTMTQQQVLQQAGTADARAGQLAAAAGAAADHGLSISVSSDRAAPSASPAQASDEASF
jgi:hypothetical protein